MKNAAKIYPEKVTKMSDINADYIWDHAMSDKKVADWYKRIRTDYPNCGFNYIKQMYANEFWGLKSNKKKTFKDLDKLLDM